MRDGPHLRIGSSEIGLGGVGPRIARTPDGYPGASGKHGGGGMPDRGVGNSAWMLQEARRCIRAPRGVRFLEGEGTRGLPGQLRSPGPCRGVSEAGGFLGLRRKLGLFQRTLPDP